MKKIVILLLCIALIFSLVSCDVSSFWSGILGTTTASTTRDLSKIETVLLEDLISDLEYEYIEYYFYDTCFGYKESPKKIYDFTEFYELLTDNGDVLMTCDQEFYHEMYLKAHRYAHFAENLENEIILHIVTYKSYLHFDCAIDIYPNGTVKFQTADDRKLYISLNEGVVDWEYIIAKYFRGEVE